MSPDHRRFSPQLTQKFPSDTPRLGQTVQFDELRCARFIQRPRQMPNPTLSDKTLTDILKRPSLSDLTGMMFARKTFSNIFAQSRAAILTPVTINHLKTKSRYPYPPPTRVYQKNMVEGTKTLNRSVLRRAQFVNATVVEGFLAVILLAIIQLRSMPDISSIEREKGHGRFGFMNLEPPTKWEDDKNHQESPSQSQDLDGEPSEEGSDNDHSESQSQSHDLAGETNEEEEIEKDHQGDFKRDLVETTWKSLAPAVPRDGPSYRAAESAFKAHYERSY